MGSVVGVGNRLRLALEAPDVVDRCPCLCPDRGRERVVGWLEWWLGRVVGWFEWWLGRVGCGLGIGWLG